MTETTYERLADVLSGLGFERHESNPGAILYVHPVAGAKLYYPVNGPTSPVLPHHLAATRMTLEWFGIATPTEFESRLQKSAG